MVARKPKKKVRSRGGASLPCPRCEFPSRVEETRRDGRTVHRARVCVQGHKFRSEERVRT